MLIMAITGASQLRAKEKISSIIEDGAEMERIFRDNYEEVCDEYVRDILSSEGFPSHANMYNVSHRIEIDSKLDEDQWIEFFEENTNYDTNEDIDHASEEDMGDMMIGEGLEHFDIEIIIEPTLNEWLEENPTSEYIENRIEEKFDPLEAQEFIENYNDEAFDEKARETLREEGVDENVNLDDVDFGVTDIELKDASSYADHVENAVDGSGETVSGYLESNMYTELVEQNRIDYNVVLESDPEEIGA